MSYSCSFCGTYSYHLNVPAMKRDHSSVNMPIDVVIKRMDACGRHSWATLALSKGIPIESVSRVLGHTNIVTTQIYALITSQKLNDDLTMLGDKLNKSFSNIKMA